MYIHHTPYIYIIHLHIRTMYVIFTSYIRMYYIHNMYVLYVIQMHPYVKNRCHICTPYITITWPYTSYVTIMTCIIWRYISVAWRFVLGDHNSKEYQIFITQIIAHNLTKISQYRIR